MGHALLRSASSSVLIGLALIGCGDDDRPPKPAREQIHDLVSGVFDDAVSGDSEGVCSVLTPTGRAHAVLRRFVDGRPLREVSEQECIDRAAERSLLSSDLPVAMKNGYRPRVVNLRFSGRNATATVRFTAFQRPWRFRRTAGIWRIEDFSLPVRE